MIYLVPFNELTAPVKLPVNATLDRLALPVIVLAWLGIVFSGAPGRPRFRFGLFDAVLGLFLLALAAGTVLNYAEIVQRGELELAIKRSTILASYIVFFYLAVTILRPGELRAFGRLILGLGCILAAGLLVEYIANFNVFTTVGELVFRSKDGPRDPLQVDQLGRSSVVGPTSHALVAATLLSIALAFAAFELSRLRFEPGVGPCPWRGPLLIAAFVLLLAGGFATQRKSSVVIPLVTLATLLLVFPPALKRVLPGLVVAAAAIALVVPTALTSVVSQLNPRITRETSTTVDRVSDYRAVLPDLEASPAFGRGYGTFEPRRYRTLDNQYLKMFVDAGLFGLMGYVLVILCAIGLAASALFLARSREGSPTPAILAGLMAFAVSNALYDTLGFPEMGYMFSFLTAAAVVASKHAAAIRAVDRRRALVSGTVIPSGPRRPPPPIREPVTLQFPGGGRAQLFGARLVAFLAALLVFGLLLGRLSQPDGSRRVTAGLLEVRQPPEWQQLAIVPRVPGLRLENATALVEGDAAESDGALVLGMSRTDEPGLLPPRLRRAAARPRSEGELVRLGRYEALRYANLQARDVAGQLTLYAISTSEGIATVYCLSGSESPDFDASCERVAATLEIRRAETYDLKPDHSFARSLSAALDIVREVRAPALQRLRAAGSSGQQGLAAQRLADSYTEASRRVRETRTSPTVAEEKSRFVTRLNSASDAYTALARAAVSDDRGAYSAARTSIRRAERGLRRALAALPSRGYRRVP